MFSQFLTPYYQAQYHTLQDAYELAAKIFQFHCRTNIYTLYSL
ncbi:MAG: hypothetical protein OFPII_12150 [Osedax symbiont Rs1]|nr:MAG: hypothetical protein OFPII_12150 [Osedax symbiont Rs1]